MNLRTYRQTLAALCLLALAACEPAPPPELESPQVAGGTELERGRYIVTIGGCNDCHTPGYMEAEGNVPEEAWLTGVPVGWRGPWGTTYARNLRLSVQNYSEAQWVDLLATRKALPPMPWMNVNQMAEADAVALYRFIQSLGPAGEAMPAPLTPDQEPTTPYFVMTPFMPEGGE